MRERLIELLKTPSNCMPHRKCESCGLNGGCQVQRQAEKLLRNGVIVPPCKVGDTVWIVLKGYVTTARVLAFYIDREGGMLDLLVKTNTETAKDILLNLYWHPSEYLSEEFVRLAKKYKINLEE